MLALFKDAFKPQINPAMINVSKYESFQIIMRVMLVKICLVLFFYFILHV